MSEQELIELCSIGESTTVQYKLEFTTQKQIAEELVAFSNTRGGIIVFGAEDKTGKMVGLTYEQVQYTSRELGNTASDFVRPVIYIETETVKHDGMLYVVAYVKNGVSKPYKDLSGNIWIKQSSDKRRVTENTEIRRLLQNSHQYQVDAEGVENSSEKDIDTKALDDYFSHVYNKSIEDFKIPRKSVLRNAHVIDDLGRMTVAGLMFFAKDPQLFRPQHCIKAVWFYGNQFIARIWRTNQKDESTTQKANEELISTTQKEELTTQKDKYTTPKPLNTTQKRILKYLKNYPKATRKDIAQALGNITENGVKFNIGLLQQYKVLKRKGGRKNGEWVVIAKLDDEDLSL